MWPNVDRECFFWYDEERRTTLTGNSGIKCGMTFLNNWNENGTVVCENMSSNPKFVSFFTFYSLSVIMTGFLITKEVLQIVYNWEQYWTSVEEFLEIGQYLVAGGYLLGIFFFPLSIFLDT